MGKFIRSKEEEGQSQKALNREKKSFGKEWKRVENKVPGLPGADTRKGSVLDKVGSWKYMASFQDMLMALAKIPRAPLPSTNNPVHFASLKRMGMT